MPQPRPASPLNLETCPTPPSDDSDDGIIASDDEMDEASRASKRQRIEKIAESYRRGAPIFILSASLRGPFEHNWKNPWKKDRRRGGQLNVADESGARNVETVPVIQETDLRDAKYRNDLSVASHSKAKHVSTSSRRSTVTELSQSPKKSPSLQPKGSGNRQLPSKLASGKSTVSQTEPSASVEEPTFVAPGTTGWLKKGGRRLNFGNFEPPSSPTPKTNLRPGKNKYISRADDAGKQHSHSPSKRQSPVTPRVSKKPHLESAVSTEQFEASSKSGAKSPGSMTATEDVHEISSTASKRAALSFRVAASTSQLPRFHYQQWNAQESSPIRAPNQPVEAPANQSPSESITVDSNNDIDQQKDPSGATPMQTDQIAEPPENGNSGNRVQELTNADTFEQTSEEQNTYEQLPSAQQIPVAPGISDRVISLHSMAISKEKNLGSASNDTQLSTQAALLHAQKSFQDDLESSEPDYEMLSEKEDGNGDESLLAHETPFLDPATAERAMPSNFTHWDKGKLQAMSSQCMFDAATPFTFSTGKKPKPFRDLSPEALGDSPAPAGIAGPSSPAVSLPSAAEDYHTAPTNDEQHIAGQQHPELASAQPSITQNSALPFVLTGSTPTTAQDGQGGLQRAESFNLSQAIADAGSWLQQSFDFMNDINHPRPNTKTGSHTEKHTSAMSLDQS